MEYTIVISDRDFPVLSAALAELPYRVAAPLIQKINLQLAKAQASPPQKPAVPEEEKQQS